MRNSESFVVVPGAPTETAASISSPAASYHAYFSILLSSLCLMGDAHVTILHLGLIVLEIFVLQKAI